MPGEAAHGAKSTLPLRTLADKVNWLISTAHPAGRGPYSNAEVAALIRKTTGSGSPTPPSGSYNRAARAAVSADAAANDGEMAGGRGGSGVNAYPVSPTALTGPLTADALVRQSLSVIVVLQCAQRGFDLRGRLSFQAALMANTDWVDMN